MMPSHIVRGKSAVGSGRSGASTKDSGGSVGMAPVLAAARVETVEAAQALRDVIEKERARQRFARQAKQHATLPPGAGRKPRSEDDLDNDENIRGSNDNDSDDDSPLEQLRALIDLGWSSRGRSKLLQSTDDARSFGMSSDIISGVVADKRGADGRRAHSAAGGCHHELSGDARSASAHSASTPEPASWAPSVETTRAFPGEAASVAPSDETAIRPGLATEGYTAGSNMENLANAADEMAASSEARSKAGGGVAVNYAPAVGHAVGHAVTDAAKGFWRCISSLVHRRPPALPAAPAAQEPFPRGENQEGAV